MAVDCVAAFAVAFDDATQCPADCAEIDAGALGDVNVANFARGVATLDLAAATQDCRIAYAALTDTDGLNAVAINDTRLIVSGTLGERVINLNADAVGSVGPKSDGRPGDFEVSALVDAEHWILKFDELADVLNSMPEAQTVDILDSRLDVYVDGVRTRFDEVGIIQIIAWHLDGEFSLEALVAIDGQADLELSVRGTFAEP